MSLDSNEHAQETDLTPGANTGINEGPQSLFSPKMTIEELRRTVTMLL